MPAVGVSEILQLAMKKRIDKGEKCLLYFLYLLLFFFLPLALNNNDSLKHSGESAFEPGTPLSSKFLMFFLAKIFTFTQVGWKGSVYRQIHGSSEMLCRKIEI